MQALDVRTLLAVLFLGNLTSVAVIAAYYFFGSGDGGERFPIRYLYAKLFQGVAYLLVFMRESFPDPVSVNIGDTLLLFGFYLEALSVNEFAPTKSPRATRAVTVIFLLAVVVFNVFEMLTRMPSYRIATTSIGIFLIMVIPSVRLLVAEGISRFKRIVSVFYLLFLVLTLPRSVYALLYDYSLFTNNSIQVLSLMSLVLLMLLGLTTFLLVIKENTDRLISTMATTDLLTGLPNRYHFFDAVDRHFVRHRMNNNPLAFLFIDIDHFKMVNDKYGHAFGDAVLARMGGLLANSVRPGDLACRYGGEEFLLVLTDISPLSAMKVAQRILEEIRAAKFPERPDFRFTASLGVYCGIPMEMDTPNDFINRADAAMYAAKTGGRNRVIMHMPDGEDAFL